MAKTWSAEVKQQARDRKRRERDRQAGIRRRRAARRREWIDKPFSTALRQLFGRR